MSQREFPKTRAATRDKQGHAEKRIRGVVHLTPPTMKTDTRGRQGRGKFKFHLKKKGNRNKQNKQTQAGAGAGSRARQGTITPARALVAKRSSSPSKEPGCGGRGKNGKRERGVTGWFQGQNVVTGKAPAPQAVSSFGSPTFSECLACL